MNRNLTGQVAFSKVGEFREQKPKRVAIDEKFRCPREKRLRHWGDKIKEHYLAKAQKTDLHVSNEVLFRV